ncbi:hypothetical protein WSM22_37120 [Cytophagales bacterium WSM2-2]|nr:hypothetical protein WSM22_37120 [Cytophagales bacterium WSM2-2]
MINQRYSGNSSPLFGSEFKSRNVISQDAVMSKNIHSCFQLAKMIVTKVHDIETKNEKLILVADDEPLTFRLIEEFFQDANLPCAILPAATGRAAYDIAVIRKPDLIITDWLMPELDGLDLIKELKANPSTRDIPVILTTGALIPNEEFNKVLEAGAIDCIRKPLDEMEFIARVKTALALHDALKEIRESQASLHTKNQFLHFLVDVAPNPIFFMDNMGNISGCNDCFSSLIGKLKTDIVGDNIFELFPQRFSTGFTVEALFAIEPGVVSKFEIEFTNPYGDDRNLLLTCIALGNSSIDVIIGSIIDVTEIVQSKNEALINLEENVEKLQTELDSKHQKLATQAELLIHSKNVKSNLIEAVTKLQPYLTNEGKSRFFSLLKQIHWELNDEMELRVEKDFDQLHTGFYNSLEKNCPGVTKNEKRLCAYLKMNHGASDIAKITNKSLNSINVAFARLRAKLQLPSSKDLRSYLVELSSQGEVVTSQ